MSVGGVILIIIAPYWKEVYDNSDEKTTVAEYRATLESLAGKVWLSQHVVRVFKLICLNTESDSFITHCSQRDGMQKETK